MAALKAAVIGKSDLKTREGENEKVSVNEFECLTGYCNCF